MARKSKRQLDQETEEKDQETPSTFTSTRPVADIPSSSSSSSSSESDLTRKLPAPASATSIDEVRAPLVPPRARKESIVLPLHSTSQFHTNPVVNTMNGTIHVKVLKASNLPTMNFGKRQDPVVLVQLDDSNPKSWATTDPAFHGNTNPEWGEGSNNELELFYDAKLLENKATLTIEVYANETGHELIGSGQLDVSSIVANQSSDPIQSTVHLNGNRGEVIVQVWFGPPVRKAFRAAGRATKLLDARDAFVGSLCSIMATICGFVSNSMPTDFAKKHRKLSIALAGILGIMGAGALTVFLAFAVPTMLVAFFTFPFWIIPFLVTSFFTAPVWVPILLLVGLFLLFIASFVFGLGATSRPVRRKGALISNKIKHSGVGKRVVYEKTI
ncbi:unnamed protein product [Peronospora belbahrii]|uniref:C2 domain-containing protein n=1 Tax=Peronospora belbahrii TaxID=622444 RepID=A0AAU9L930_9STRA|nr:unnamed protein product [Peronospora belbahrii]CAH0517254.1 unnamed protein product [Peronospora belbahrii]